MLNKCIFHLKILSFFSQKVNGPGFALGETILGTQKIQKFNLHFT